jgi:hypothetical protein
LSECDGTERHSHYVLSTSETFYHTHEHSVIDGDFNRLHHHPPIEHDNFTTDQLEKDGEYVKVPW